MTGSQQSSADPQSQIQIQLAVKLQLHLLANLHVARINLHGHDQCEQELATKQQSCNKDTQPHLLLNFLRVLMVNCAAYRLASTQDLLDCARELPRTAPVPHDSGNLNDII